MQKVCERCFGNSDVICLIAWHRSVKKAFQSYHCRLQIYKFVKVLGEQALLADLKMIQIVNEGFSINKTTRDRITALTNAKRQLTSNEIDIFRYYDLVVENIH